MFHPRYGTAPKAWEKIAYYVDSRLFGTAPEVIAATTLNRTRSSGIRRPRRCCSARTSTTGRTCWTWRRSARRTARFYRNCSTRC
ncbi:MAG: hypothetical protein R3F11_08465 [Verrucomicrobiales bacterium]